MNEASLCLPQRARVALLARTPEILKQQGPVLRDLVARAASHAQSELPVGQCVLSLRADAAHLVRVCLARCDPRSSPPVRVRVSQSRLSCAEQTAQTSTAVHVRVSQLLCRALRISLQLPCVLLPKQRATPLPLLIPA